MMYVQNLPSSAELHERVLQIFGANWESNGATKPIAAKFMEKNYKGQWVSRGITAVAFGRLTEGSAVLLMPSFKLQKTVSAGAGAVLPHILLST